MPRPSRWISSVSLASSTCVGVFDPPDVEPVLRPGEGDVEEPALFGLVLCHRQRLIRSKSSPSGPPTSMRRGRGVSPATGLRVVEHRNGRATRRPVPGERDEHDRVLEPLGAVDGLHLDRVGVGLEPALS